MRLTDFFPSRKHGVRCPTCARRARIPLNVVLLGVVVMFGEIGLLMWLFAATNVLHPRRQAAWWSRSSPYSAGSPPWCGPCHCWAER
jgi:hypothetical protein